MCLDEHPYEMSRGSINSKLATKLWVYFRVEIGVADIAECWWCEEAGLSVDQLSTKSAGKWRRGRCNFTSESTFYEMPANLNGI